VEQNPDPDDKRPRSTPRGRPKWETDTNDRIRAAVRTFVKPLHDLQARQANEGDTRLLVTDFLCYALGYDKFTDLTTEYAVKGEYADYGVRIDNEVRAFIEVKRVGTKLGPRQLRQVESYALNEGAEWMILTNGNEWQVYHLTGGLPIVIDHVFTVTLTGDGETPAKRVEKLFYLSRESFKRNQIDELWKARRATAPQSIARVMLSEPVIQAARRELRRATGHSIEPGELAELVRSTVLRPESLDQKS